MELAPLLIALGLAAIAVAYVARPLVEGAGREPDARERRLSALRAEQDQTLALLHELDMDYAMGKIEADDYAAQRSARVMRGAAILREIDELGPAVGAPPSAKAPPPPIDLDLETRVAQLRTRAAGFCAHCGTPLVLGDRFCTRCGEAVPGAGG
jgi:hypothetical protein